MNTKNNYKSMLYLSSYSPGSNNCSKFSIMASLKFLPIVTSITINIILNRYVIRASIDEYMVYILLGALSNQRCNL